MSGWKYKIKTEDHQKGIGGTNAWCNDCEEQKFLYFLNLTIFNISNYN